MNILRLLSYSSQFRHFGLLVIVTVLLFGCAVVPQPTNDVYIVPVDGHPNTKVNPESGAVTIVQKGVAVIIKPMDEVDIFSLTDNPRINPYLFVGNNGNVEPIYTVFELTVHNLEAPRVLVDESALLIDRTGAQYANLPYDYFKDLYNNVNRRDQNVHTPMSYPQFNRNYPYYQTYLDIDALEEGHAIVAESLFENGKLFRGAKRSGLIIFDRLSLDTTDMRILIPDIRIVHSDDKHEKLKFKYDFRQVIAKK